jgi:hypothetical protein
MLIITVCNKLITQEKCMRGLRYYWVPPLYKFFMNANYGCLHTENLDCRGRNQGGKRAQAPTQHFNFFYLVFKYIII